MQRPYAPYDPYAPYASGGLVPMPKMGLPAAKIAPPTPSGLIASTVPGRTDRHAMKVRPGSFIVPADVVSGVGQGNTLAGAQLLGQALKAGPYGSAGSGPYGAELPKIKKSGIGLPRRTPSLRSMMRPPPMPYADGGVPETTDILTAGGEMILDPEDVAYHGGGDLKAGQAALANMVKTVRAQTIAQLRSLPGPKR